MLQRLLGGTRHLVRSVTGQTRAADRWSSWAAATQLLDFRIWVHAPSVGEGLVAEPVLARLVQSIGHPATVVRSYTSPSAAAWDDDFPYAYSDYLPSPWSLHDVIRTVRPSVILYPRGDLWPSLVTVAAKANIPQMVIGGLLRDDSRRLNLPARSVTALMIDHLAAIGAVSEPASVLWQRMGASPGKITLTGDPRDDHVLERVSDVGYASALAKWAAGGFVLLAGSTEPSDEKHVLRAAADITGRTIIVPHDPTPHAIRRLVTTCTKLGLDHCLVMGQSVRPDSRARVLIVGEVGNLQDLYCLATVAFVGGGFHGSRVHAVVEPASLGVPILIGPGGVSDPSAKRFVEAGGARVVYHSDDIMGACRDWTEEEERRRAGLNARRVLATGAAAKTVDMILRKLDEVVG